MLGCKKFRNNTCFGVKNGYIHPSACTPSDRCWVDDDAPKVEYREVKHSKWVGFPNNGVWDLKCDICHRVIPFGQTPETMHYCPECGAIMDKLAHEESYLISELLED